jgi:PAS domain S-box-containing protein
MNHGPPAAGSGVLERILAGVSDAFVAFDCDWRYTYVNSRAAEIAGMAAVDMLGRTLWDLFPAVLGTEMEAGCRRAVATGTAQRFESYDPPFDRWFEQRLYPTPDGLIILSTEITDRKRAEEALRASEADFRAMFELAGVGKVQADPVTGRFLRVNRKQCEITGYSRDELLALTFAAITHPDDRDRDRAQFDQMVRGEISAESIEKRYVRKDGAVVWVHVTATLIRDAEGRPLRSVAVVQDVTDRKRAEEELRASEQRFARFAQHLPGLAWIKDLQGRYVYANDAAMKVFGTPREVLYGKTDDEIFPPATAAQFKANDRQALASGAGVQVIETLEHEDGVVHHSLVSKFPVPGPDGRPALVGGMAIDVTDRLRIEEALREADRRKDEFLAVLAHELRNPLAPIRNAVHMLKLTGSADPDAGRVREMIERQVAHLARLVDDLLDVSRISRGKVLLRREPLDLAAVVRAAVEDHRLLLEATGLTVEADLPARPLGVEGDRTRLAQVVGNLLQNANKFTDPGGRVTVRLAAEPGGAAAVLTVRDTGIGLGPDVLARLFEPFSQADRSLDRSRGGLGLGLALVKGLVELHGGSVAASSPGPGAGSEFTVRLPLAGHGPRSDAAGRDAEPETRDPKSLRVLIVEDNRDAAESLRLLLELGGHRVRVGHAGPAGLEAAREFRPDVVLCDIGLPGGMDGYAVARAFRADPGQAGTALVALSGYGREEDRRRACEAGFDHHLTKPVDPEVLDRLLATLPGGRG